MHLILQDLQEMKLAAMVSASSDYTDVCTGSKALFGNAIRTLEANPDANKWSTVTPRRASQTRDRV